MKNNELRDALTNEYELHPEMQITDCMKLIYQNEFGCEHLLTTEEGPREYLMQEWKLADRTSTTDLPGEPLIQYIGNNNLRLNLAPAKTAGLPEKVVFRLFLLSAGGTNTPHSDMTPAGRKISFEEKVMLFAKWCDANVFPFKGDEIRRAYTIWVRSGEGPFSHSERYRELYKPCYRVLRRTLGKTGMPFIIGIDGRCGAGKSTMARILSKIFDAPIIHMDDFFLPPKLRTEKRLSEAGGNVHYERFINEAANPLRAGDSLTYRKFDCSIMDYNGTVDIPAVSVEADGTRKNCVIIVEGSYAFHPAIEAAGTLYDMRIFCDINPELQKKRILARDGEDTYKIFRDKWIPMEEAYFKSVFSEIQGHFLQVESEE